MKDVADADCVIVAVAYNEFKEMSLDELDKLYKVCSNDEKVLVDVKGILDKKIVEDAGYKYWRL